MSKLTKNQQEVLTRLESGKTISIYPTGRGGYTDYYRWDDNLEVVPLKTIWSMRSKGVEIIVGKSDRIVNS